MSEFTDGDPNPADEAGAETPGPNPADELAAASSRATAGILVEVVGGGEGPGWTGDYYMGVMVQKGIIGRFSGTLDEIQKHVAAVAGGALYKWSGLGSDGKAKGGTFRIPGPPRLHSPDDPAARDAYERAQAERDARARYGSSNPNPGAPVSYDQDRALNYLNNRWVWVPDQFRYEWVSFDQTPPPGPAPRHPPFTGSGYGAASYSPQEDPRDKLLRELVDEVKSLKKGGTGGGESLLVAMMNNQLQASLAADASRRADEATRWQRELEVRREERETRERLAVSNEKIELERIKALKSQVPPDMATALKSQLELHQSLKETFGSEKKDEKDEASTGERIGEKVVDGVNNFLKFGKEWLEDRKKTREKDGKTQAPKTGAAPSDAGIDAQTLQWVKILEAVHDHYGQGHPPDRALEGVAQVCRGMDVEFDSVATQLAKIDKAQDLFQLLELTGDAAKSRLEPIATDLGNGDGLAWLNNVLARIKMLGKK